LVDKDHQQMLIEDSLAANTCTFGLLLLALDCCPH
jgi:hypothetical protein